MPSEGLPFGAYSITIPYIGSEIDQRVRATPATPEEARWLNSQIAELNEMRIREEMGLRRSIEERVRQQERERQQQVVERAHPMPLALDTSRIGDESGNRTTAMDTQDERKDVRLARNGES